MKKITNEEILELKRLAADIYENDALADKLPAALDRLAELEKANEKLIWKPVAGGINNECDLFEIRTGGDISTTHVVLQLEDTYDIDEIKNQREGMYFGRWYLEDIIEDYPDAEWREIVEAI